MKKLYLVVLSTAIARDQILRQLEQKEGFGVWFYSIANSFFVFSSLSADSVYQAIRGCIPKDERIFVTEVSRDNRQGFLPKTHWDRIHWEGADLKFSLSFQGYYRKAEYLLPKAGVYCVYRGIYNPSDNTVSLIQLLYIGQSINVRDRHLNHENLEEWKRLLRAGEELEYSMAILPENELERCEAALIYKNKPPCNHTGIDSFGFLPTMLDIKGCAALLKGGLVE